jgi:hypothetical protein
MPYAALPAILPEVRRILGCPAPATDHFGFDDGAKALYPKRVPRVRIPPSPSLLSSFELETSSLRERTSINRKRSLAKHYEAKGTKDPVFLTRK